MREGWKEVKLGEVCNVINGFAFKSKDFVKEGIPLVKIKELKDKRINLDHCDYLPANFAVNEKFKVHKGDVLIALTGSHITLPSSAVGRVSKSLIDKTLFLNQRVGKFVAYQDKCDLNFLYFFLTSEDFFNNVGLLAKGAANQANISGEDVKTISINLPPLSTQRKIANILSGYDDLIENNQKRIKILEEMAQQTYEEWFVRMRFPGYETAVFDEDGLPEGWEKDLVGNQLGKVKSTNKIKSSDIEKNGSIPVVDQSRDFIAGYTDDESAIIKYEDTPFIVFGDHTRILKLVNFDFARGADGTQIIISNNECLPQHLLYLTLINVDLSNYHYARHYKYLKDSEIVIPSKNVANKFELLGKKNFDAIQTLRMQNQHLREARDILLPRLMMGMIDVKSLEAKPIIAKLIPLEQPKKEASKEFKEAVLIACLTGKFGSEKYPLGRKRYTKLSYLFHRYSDNKIQDYLRKAAGPYNPKTKYGGPEKIALNSKYIKDWKGEKGTTGFVVAEKIDDAKKYFSNYWQIADLDWLTSEFKFKSNDELELLATVDNSLVELSKKNLEFTSANVLDIIKSEKEWEAKLERTIFSDANVERAIGFLRGVLEYEK
ncbi:restriction endonuclease subunit S [Chryseobacterium sp. Ch-15]|uniref:Restriction endonuclease subunit S n=1 Tax=Chryseobacterium muglaense TaxID=2893752 RepID=A0A9Q3YQI6_9FLAO|nr:restriction endonuclease subunit S [Chryseobacterium muglaense]MBD3906506.1 restriction endonuclease subunit S [Chryseobacterium muglaense]MCC9034011.1 restriction endonuclease subunit S [Chryseobacterium muglaense]MCM2556214.1 restriction endonuclease subunit S [Chryseobacterium muglaense]